MARGGSFVFDGIDPVLAYMVGHTATNVANAMEDGKVALEEYARSNAPWADRTGMARAGLVGSVYMEGLEVVAEIAHTVEYGYWLELIQDGTYAILLPTIEAVGPGIIRDAGAAATSVGVTY